MLDTCNIVKDIMFSWQSVFEYRDKPEKQLVKLLVETEDRSLEIRMRKEDELCAMTPQEKLSIYSRFSESLYTSACPSQNTIRGFLTTIIVPELLDEQREVLQSAIQESEILQAIDKLKLNKTPGPDSFTTKFYKMFKHTLAPKLCRLFASCFTLQQIPTSSIQARIVVIQRRTEICQCPNHITPYHC